MSPPRSHGDEVGADGGRITAQVGCQVGARPVGEDVRVLEQQEVLLRPGEHRLWTASASRYGTEPSQRIRSGPLAARGAHSSVIQSLVSRISFTRTRNPAA